MRKNVWRVEPEKMKCCEVIEVEDIQMMKIYEKVEKCPNIRLLYRKYEKLEMLKRTNKAG